MDTILLLLHTGPDGGLTRAARETVAAGQQILRDMPGASLVAGVVGGQVQPAIEQLASSGASRLLAVEGPAFGPARHATDAAAAAALIRSAQATLVLAAGTSRWSRALPAAAHRCQGCIDTHATGWAMVDGSLAITRWYYRQRMEAQLRRTPRPWLILFDPGIFPPWDGAPGPAQAQRVEVDAGPNLQRTRVEGVQAPAAQAQTIRPDADLLLVAGAGWTKKQADGRAHVQEAEALLLDFLAKSRASLGSSKSLVDLSGEGEAVLSFLTHLNQVGQTGSTPRHPKGLATCCHGEEPHAVGWRFIHERRAINLDPGCGWARGKADVLYVADAFAVLAAVNARLAQAAPPAPGTPG